VVEIAMNEVGSMNSGSSTHFGSSTPAADAASILPSLTVPTLAELAMFTPDRTILESHSIVGFDSRDARARPFNLLRTQLAKRMAGSKARIVGITSATPNAGKSFLSLNIAAALSRVAEQAVYLLDLDLRRGSIGGELGMEPEAGISDFLDGSTDELTGLGSRVDGTNLAVFATRAISGNSAELLAGERYARLITAFRAISENAIVLCDMPPAFANDDAMIAMQALDGYLMVVDSGKTTRRQIQDTMAMLQPSPCLGAILNRYNGGIMESAGYGYGYGFKGYDAYYS
jgi:Mrp family chromosome partitioning ATPase